MVKREGRRQRSIQLAVVSIDTASEDVDYPAGASITYVSKHDRDLLSELFAGHIEHVCR